MFSKQQKHIIAEEVEKLLLSFNHPEMPSKEPYFKLYIAGKDEASWANIEPNWTFEEPEDSYEKCADDILKLDLLYRGSNKKDYLVSILKCHFGTNVPY